MITERGPVTADILSMYHKATRLWLCTPWSP